MTTETLAGERLCTGCDMALPPGQHRWRETHDYRCKAIAVGKRHQERLDQDLAEGTWTPNMIDFKPVPCGE